jgi:hypothetical protein
MDKRTRRYQEAVLEHPLRAEILDLLGDGGLGLRELHRQLSGEHSETVVVLNLARLQAVELVRWGDGIYRVV